MEAKVIHAIIGTNAWGTKTYGKTPKGKAKVIRMISEMMEEAVKRNYLIIDTSQRFGLGRTNHIIPKVISDSVMISSHFIPLTNGGDEDDDLQQSLYEDLGDFKRDKIAIYWLRQSSNLVGYMQDMIILYRQGLIRYIGVANMKLDDVKKAKAILDAEGIPLFGVMHQYSVMTKDEEVKQTVTWCHENNIQFFAWGTLENGLLTGKTKGINKLQAKAYLPMIQTLKMIGRDYDLTPAQVATAYINCHGMVPVVGIWNMEELIELDDAMKVELKAEDMALIDEMASYINIISLSNGLITLANRSVKKVIRNI